MPVISPGQTVDVTITWTSKALLGSVWLGVSNCVRAGKVDERDLDKAWVPTPSSGTTHTQTSFVVPNSLDGLLLCDSARLWVSLSQQIKTWNAPDWTDNPSSTRWLKLEVSNSLCWFVGPAAQAPEARLPIVLGVLALCCAGGYVVVIRRRERKVGDASRDSSSDPTV